MKNKTAAKHKKKYFEDDLDNYSFKSKPKDKYYRKSRKKEKDVDLDFTKGN